MTNPEKTDTQKTEQAAWNNAAWCDAVCRAHGQPGEFREAAWINFAPVPPFYPNLVTLGGAQQAEAHRKRVSECVQAEMPAGWTVKDSFQTLDLIPLGFQVLFDAQWINWPVSLPLSEKRVGEVRWETVTTVPALASWEAAWSGEPGGRGVFLPPLLANKDVAMIAACLENEIIAGAIANRAAESVGLSNIFLPAGDAHVLRGGCVARAREAFPGLPVVGYESGADLAEMRALGFEVTGPLRVWRQVS